MRKLWNEHKRTIILSSLVILLPMVAGLLLWDQLPATMTSHWNAAGVADGTSPKASMVFGLPLGMLAAQWLIILCTALDKGNREQTPKALGLVFWIMPVMSLFLSGLVYTTALGMDYSVEKLVPLVLGACFLACGNYFPKIKCNATLGIKLPWTVYNEENWNATHRLGGKVWVVGGLVMLISALLPLQTLVTVFLVTTAVLILVPTVYSYLYYRKQKQRPDFVSFSQVQPKSHKVFSTVILVAVLGLVAVLMFTGDINYQLREDSLYVEADYWQDLPVDYDEIDAIEYREDFAGGTRTNGYGSARLLMGTFKNEEFGYYTLYTYGKPDAVIVLRDGDEVLVLGAENEVATRALYEALVAHIH